MDLSRIQSIKCQFEFCKLNRSLPFNVKKSISCSLNADLVRSLEIGIDMNAVIIKSIETDINSHILKTIVSDLSKSTNIDYIDVRNIDDDDQFNLINDKIIEKSRRENLKNCIVSSRIGSIISFGSNFISKCSWKPTLSNDISNYCYSIGKIDNVNIFIDTFLRFDSDEIYLFDDIELNFEISSFRISNEPTFSPRLVVNFESALNFGDFEKIYLIRDDSSRIEEYNRYMIPTRREEKINVILNI